MWIKRLFSSNKWVLSPNFALALGGGSARWIAHMGVYKYLAEYNYEPRQIAWTSMWSIMWACIAFGMGVDDVINIIQDVKFHKLIDIDLKKWLIKGDKIESFFEKLFDGKNIQDADIPLRIVATDIDSGQKRVFTRGKVSQAIRASISIPWVFVPYKDQHDRYLIDGWVVSNIPVEVLDNKNILAVGVTRDSSRDIDFTREILGFKVSKTFVETNYQVLQKTFDIMMVQNEKNSLNTPWKDVTYLKPKFPHIDYREFDKYNELIDIGYQYAKKNLMN